MRTLLTSDSVAVPANLWELAGDELPPILLRPEQVAKVLMVSRWIGLNAELASAAPLTGDSGTDRGLTCAFALGCGGLMLLEAGGNQTGVQRTGTDVVSAAPHDSATTPWWAKWSEVAGEPSIVSGAMLSTVVLLLPSTRRGLETLGRAIEPGVGGGLAHG